MPDSVFMGLPGGNPSGSSVGNPINMTGQNPTPGMGGSTNPLVPNFPSGTNSPGLTFPANTGGMDLNQLLAGLTSMGGGGMAPGMDVNAVAKGFNHAGFPNAIAGMLASFLQQGAGFNPKAISGIIASLMPQISRGESNIMEQFGAAGLRDSSAAAIGLGDFESSATLDIGQIISQMYEQSVQNYMDVLLSGRKPTSNTAAGAGSILGGAGSLLQSIPGLAGLGGGAAAAGGAAGIGSIGAAAGAGFSSGDALAALLPLVAM